MMSIRAEMRELLDTWSDWATPADNPIQSCLNNIWASFLFILCFLLAVVVKGYLISAYLLSFIWPWSSRNRKTNGLQQFALRAGNTISVVPHQEQNQDITRKSENILFHRIPFEIRPQILMLAFGDQTVHMDLQFRYPLALADECLFYDYHARIEGTSMNPVREITKGEKKDWRWFSCVCHRFPPYATHLPLGRRRTYLGSPFFNPDKESCLKGSGTCKTWPGEWPVKCQIGITGWLLSCKQAYLEGIDILYKTNTIHIASPVLLRSIQDVVSRQRLEDITSLELVWEPKILPLELGFTSSNNSQHKSPTRPIFPCLQFLRISFEELVSGEEDCSLGIVWPYEDQKILSHRLHHHFLPKVDTLLEKIVQPTTDVTVTCPQWDWYVAIDCFLMEKQGKEETRMHRADVEGLKCWRNTPGRIEDVSDGVLDSGVEGRRKGFWIHICIYDVELDKGRNYSYDQDRHDLYNLGPERYRFREETVIDTNSFVYNSDY